MVFTLVCVTAPNAKRNTTHGTASVTSSRKGRGLGSLSPVPNLSNACCLCVQVLQNYLWGRTTSAHAANDGASQCQNASETRQDHYSKETTLNSPDVIAVVNCSCKMIVGKTD